MAPKALRILPLAVIVSACGAGWHGIPTPFPNELAPRQQAQVWTRGHSLQWHAIIVTADSISGIPFFKPVTCDTCRLTLPLTAVDSVRAGDPVSGFWRTVGLVLLINVLVLAYICRGGCARD